MKLYVKFAWLFAVFILYNVSICMELNNIYIPSSQFLHGYNLLCCYHLYPSIPSFFSHCFDNQDINFYMEGQGQPSSPSFQFPPGFRFHPSDEELIVYYLQNKVTSRPLPASIIAEIDLYKYNPWELPSQFFLNPISIVLFSLFNEFR